MLHAAALALLLAIAPIQGIAAQALTIEFLDVGQGDAALVLTPDRRSVLIDAGPVGAGVAARLRAGGIDTLDLVIASHNHADHIGGMPEVLSSIPVRFYLENGVPASTAIYARTVRSLESRNVSVLAPTRRTITVGRARIRVLPPPPLKPGEEEQNNASVGVVVEFGSFRALLTGDSEQPELEWWLEHDTIPPVQLLKVAHHGSRNGTVAAWIAATHPLAAVVSVGAHNGYGHPSERVLQEWSAVAERVYRTDRDGRVTVHADSTGRFAVTAEARLDCLRMYVPAGVTAAEAREATDVLCH